MFINVFEKPNIFTIFYYNVLKFVPIKTKYGTNFKMDDGCTSIQFEKNIEYTFFKSNLNDYFLLELNNNCFSIYYNNDYSRDKKDYELCLSESVLYRNSNKLIYMLFKLNKNILIFNNINKATNNLYNILFNNYIFKIFIYIFNYKLIENGNGKTIILERNKNEICRLFK